MDINTALVLCAGYGKRLNPITLNKPKPLIEINQITLLENTINLINSLGIKKILINTFYLSDQIKEYVEKLNFKASIEIVHDGERILDTGGGILNLLKNSDQENFVIFNPDTIWNENYLQEIENMKKFFFENNLKNILLIVEKSKSFDQRMKGDFSVENGKLSKLGNKKYIFTGCQILNRKVFENYKINTFSINEIWEKMISNKELYGHKSQEIFTHVTDFEIYQKLTKT